MNLCTPIKNLQLKKDTNLASFYIGMFFFLINRLQIVCLQYMKYRMFC